MILKQMLGKIMTDMGFVTQHQLEEALLRQRGIFEEKYRRLVENANDAIFIVQDEVAKFPNPETEAMIGYSTEELANIPFTNFIRPEDRGLALERHKRRMTGENPPSTYSFRIINRAGEELWVQVNTVLITWEGHINRNRDI